MTARIAVLDDEVRMAEVLAMVLRRDGHQVDTFHQPESFLNTLEGRDYDLLLTDLKMPTIDGLEVLRRSKQRIPEMPVILVTAHATVQTAISALRAGAFDYVEKPFNNDSCRALVARALELTQLQRENRYLRMELKSRHQLREAVFASAAMGDVLDLARRAARSRATVLISGESGTGKEVVARSIHYHSDRVGSPFIAVNCKAFAESVLEAELFGSEKGAFTGAVHSRSGIFEQAHGGTLFLDEIGETGLDFQVKLLRVLQEREILPVGSAKTRSIDVRVVAATNRLLREEIEKGRFREDLYFRLAVIPIRIPPLRERRDDILPLARAFLQRFTTGSERVTRGWSPEVEAWLLQHSWPGNVRELENVIERATVLCTSEQIQLEDLLLDDAALEDSIGTSSAKTPAIAQASGGLQAFLDQAAIERVQVALHECQGRRAEAARKLGIDRSTLFRLMKRLKMEGE